MTFHSARFPMKRIGTAGPSLAAATVKTTGDYPPAPPLNFDGRTPPVVRQAFTNFANSRTSL
jgi:hypothetical protein